MTKEQRLAREESRRASIEHNQEQKRIAVEQARRDRPSGFEVFDYTPIPIEPLEETLRRFDAERAEAAAEQTHTADLEDIAEKVADKCGDELRAVIAVTTHTTKDGTPYEEPQNEEVAVAWKELLETVSDWMDSDTYRKAEPELIRRLKNVLQAVDLACDFTGVKDKELELEGIR
jgi:hypothetical protein